MAKKVSIIIPCYNVEKYIKECVDSIINQTIGFEDNIEIIFIDDASTDGTRDILKDYETQYSENILLICNDNNARQGACRNLALKYASGDYISFVDGDDWLDLNMYSLLVALMETQKADVVQFKHRYEADYKRICQGKLEGAALYDFSCEGVKDAGFGAGAVEQQRLADDRRREMITNSDYYDESCHTKIFRKDLVDSAGVGYAEGVYYEEPLFTYPLKFFCNRLVCISSELYVYRHNPTGTVNSKINNADRMYDHLYVQHEVLKFMRNTCFYERFKEEIDFYFLHTFCVEPFYFLGYRGISMPPEMLKDIYDIVIKEYGVIPENDYFNHDSMKDEKNIIEIIRGISS